jgi:hypothetical protein
MEDLNGDVFYSIENNNIIKFISILETGINVDFLYYEYKIGFITPLIKAILEDKPIFIRELLKYGANPNIVTDIEPVLILALYNHDINIYKLLLKNGANPFLKDINGDTAYDIAINRRHNFTEIELLKDAMIRRIQSRSRRYLTRKLVKANRRLALSKHMLNDGNLTEGNLTKGNLTNGNPMSYMDYDTILELSRYL